MMITQPSLGPHKESVLVRGIASQPLHTTKERRPGNPDRKQPCLHSNGGSDDALNTCKITHMNVHVTKRRNL